MKIFDIALKDMLRNFRSAFLLVMMFLVPILVTGLIYFAFGSFGREQKTSAPQPVRVGIANLDQPDARSVFAAGKIIEEALLGRSIAEILRVTVAANERDARSAVERQKADVAVIIPPDFTRALVTPGSTAAVTIYHDPVKTIGPAIVKTIINEFADGFAGARISVEVVSRQMNARGQTIDPITAEAIARRYAEWIQRSGFGSSRESPQSLLSVQPPQAETRTSDPFTVYLGPVMAGLMIFFVFFTGAATAESIILEQDEGTLARLFTTPTPQSIVLAGKFISVFMTIIVQILVLLLASSLLFHIRWGKPITIVLAATSLAVSGSGFGVFLMSFVKSTRHAGFVVGIVVSITGILGGLVPMGDPSRPSPLEPFNLAIPQGWAMRAWKLALSGMGAAEVLLPVAVLLSIGAALFISGTFFFRKRLQ